MASYNKVTLLGNLTRDPELKHTPGGVAVAEFGLAMNEKFKNKAGETVEEVCYVDITVWGKQAENVAEYLKKGSSALVDGKLVLDQWESGEVTSIDAETGEKTTRPIKKSKLRVRADRVVFTGSAPGKPAPTDADAPAEQEDDIPF